ncbi:hypothetical protein, partial [Luteimonas sp. A482]
ALGPMAISAAIVVLVLGGALPQSSAPVVPDNALSLAGVSLGDSEASATDLLGQPVARRKTGDFLSVELEFQGLTVWLGEDNRVAEILSTSANYCTPQGVCPGQPFAVAQARYGKPIVAVREDATYMEYLPQSDFPCWLQIAVESATISSIRSECQP